MEEFSRMCAAAVSDYTRLKEENTRLLAELERARESVHLPALAATAEIVPIPLRVSSTPHSYYHGDFQGTLQYHKSKAELIAINEFNDTETNGFVLEEHTLENKRRVLPHTKNPDDYKIILAMKRTTPDPMEAGAIIEWLKLALEHKETGEIALLTASNNERNITSQGNRAIKSNEPGWFVGFYRMSAPMCFWKELKNRLTV
jgi:hypothetical protein